MSSVPGTLSERGSRSGHCLSKNLKGGTSLRVAVTSSILKAIPHTEGKYTPKQ